MPSKTTALRFIFFRRHFTGTGLIVNFSNTFRTQILFFIIFRGVAPCCVTNVLNCPPKWKQRSRFNDGGIEEMRILLYEIYREVQDVCEWWNFRLNLGYYEGCKKQWCPLSIRLKIFLPEFRYGCSNFKLLIYPYIRKSETVS